MRPLSDKKFKEAVALHQKWLERDPGGVRLDLTKAVIKNKDLSNLNLSDAILVNTEFRHCIALHTDFEGADMSQCAISDTTMRYANLSNTNLACSIINACNLSRALLDNAKLTNTNITYCSLYGATLREVAAQNAAITNCDARRASFFGAQLRSASVDGTMFSNATFEEADLTNIRGLVRPMGVTPGGIYWKAISRGLENRGYKFKIGLNTLEEGEEFANDPRFLCSYPGFHFAGLEWVKAHYFHRDYLCKIRIPEWAEVNEPYGSDGKASASAIEILQVFLMESGEDVTSKLNAYGELEDECYGCGKLHIRREWTGYCPECEEGKL